MNVETFLQSFCEWALEQPDIEGVALVGSHARKTAGPHSDVDLMILTTARSRCFDDQNWLSRFGKVEQSEIEPWGRMETLRVFYSTGLEIEYGFAPLEWAAAPIDPGTQRVVSDGFEVLFDRNYALMELLNNLPQ